MRLKTPEQGSARLHKSTLSYIPVTWTSQASPTDDLGQTQSGLSSDITTILEVYTGEIQEVEGDMVHATLYRDTERFSAELPKRSFEPGGPLIPGQTFMARWVARQDGSEDWSNLPDPPRLPTPEELRQWGEEFAHFDGSGL